MWRIDERRSWKRKRRQSVTVVFFDNRWSVVGEIISHGRPRWFIFVWASRRGAIRTIFQFPRCWWWRWDTLDEIKRAFSFLNVSSLFHRIPRTNFSLFTDIGKWYSLRWWKSRIVQSHCESWESVSISKSGNAIMNLQYLSGVEIFQTSLSLYSVLKKDYEIFYVKADARRSLNPCLIRWLMECGKWIQ